MTTSFNVNLGDLQFILRQIKIGEASSEAYNAAPKTILQAIMDEYGVTAANAAQLPAGLRTVDGSFNSLLPGQENLGAADAVFPRLLTPVFTNEGDEAAFQGITNTNYANPGNVVDSDPRTISNLVVNQTASNPAAVMAALQHSVFSETLLPNQVAGAAAAIATAYAATVGLPPSDPAHANLTALLNSYGIEQGPEGGLVIPNLSPDIGLSPGFNAWMTFFGQFFDHGLDLVTKGGNGKVYIPLAADDPLIAGADNQFGTADDLPAHLRFMELTRATTAVDLNGDGDTTDAGETGNTQGQNTTTSFVDQNQTYTSHASHQVFLREYVRVGDQTLATGKLIDGQTANGSLDGAIGNWAEVKAQALSMLGIKLTDFDVGNVPWLRTDQYGKFIPDPVTGFAQVIVGIGLDGKPNTADDIVVSGTATGIDLETVGALRTGHAFLNDIAHHAGPGFVDFNHDGVLNGPDVLQTADTDYLDYNRDGVVNQADVDAGVLAGDLVDADGSTVVDIEDLKDVNLDGAINAADLVADDRNKFTYDNEMLDAHFVTGDGRGNENIALTTVHSIFHSEHNRLVDVNKITLLREGSLSFLNEWLSTDVASLPVIPPNATDADVLAIANTLNWDGERLFQSARFSTEMQYQHMVFEEFARRVQPMVDPFVFNSSPNVDPSIIAEFAHTVYRFGHSMLTDTVDRLDNDLTTLASDEVSQETLIAAFLNPQMYISSGATLAEANADIIRGLTHQLGNEIDEFVVPALQSNLLGLPLDLPALNIARGRETGVPSLNETRAQLYNDFGIVDLKPYASWSEFALAIKNPLSVINFIAAYGTHSTITSATTLEDKREAAYALVTGIGFAGDPADRPAFLNGTGTLRRRRRRTRRPRQRRSVDRRPRREEERVRRHARLDLQLHLRIPDGEPAERRSVVLPDPHAGPQLPQQPGAQHLLRPGDAQHRARRRLRDPLERRAVHHAGPHHRTRPRHRAGGLQWRPAAGLDPEWEGLDPVTAAIIGPKVVRDYTGSVVVDGTHDFGGYIRVQGGEHYVIGGTEGDDQIYSDSGIDTIWGDGGDDYINAGTESDDVFGGLGDDIIEDPFGDDVLRGNQGNDVITSARGADLLFGDEGKDSLLLARTPRKRLAARVTTSSSAAMARTSCSATKATTGSKAAAVSTPSPATTRNCSSTRRSSATTSLFNQGDEGDYDAELGDDIMGSGASVFRYEGMFGFDWAIGKGDFSPPASTSTRRSRSSRPFRTTSCKDRFDQVEAFSGWKFDDKLVRR